MMTSFYPYLAGFDCGSKVISKGLNNSPKVQIFYIYCRGLVFSSMYPDRDLLQWQIVPIEAKTIVH